MPVSVSFELGYNDSVLSNIVATRSIIRQALWKGCKQRLENHMSDLRRQRKEVEKRVSLVHMIREQQLRKDVKQHHEMQVTRYETNDRARILYALSDLDYKYKHQSVHQERFPSTCEWLFDDKAFIQWKNDPSDSLLMLWGIPGCGKVIPSPKYWLYRVITMADLTLTPRQF